MTLHYLDFDYHGDEHGHGTLEAMASVPAHRVAAVREEIARVLGWAFEAFADQRGPLDEGGEWDYQLDARQEWSAPELLAYDQVTRRFASQPGEMGEPLHVLTLSLSGTELFCQEVRSRFGL